MFYAGVHLWISGEGKRREVQLLKNQDTHRNVSFAVFIFACLAACQPIDIQKIEEQNVTPTVSVSPNLK